MSNQIDFFRKVDNSANEVICCGARQNTVVAVVLAILALLVCATAFWLFSHNFGTIPAFVSGCGLTLLAIGSLAVSITYLMRSFFKK